MSEPSKAGEVVSVWGGVELDMVKRKTIMAIRIITKMHNKKSILINGPLSLVDACAFCILLF